jgi:RsiW-degrading membrane proteinase PrsW (M82 family)
MDGLVTLFLSLLGGILPAVLWLLVWLRHDPRPEPKQRIVRAFLCGMMCVPISVAIQTLVASRWFDTTSLAAIIGQGALATVLALALWALIEEFLKYIVGWVTVLNSDYTDEPMDPIIYMITIALGFAAMENALYLIKPLLEMNGALILQEGFARIIGSTLIHVAASAIIGMAHSFTMFAFARSRVPVRFVGLLCATGLHTLFNILIISNEHLRIAAYALVWTTCVSLVVLFEKIKQVHLNIITIHEEA